MGLDRLHDGLPLIILQLEIEGFLSSVFNCAVSWGHFVPSETCNHPLQALVRQNLDLEADKLNFLRIGKVSISLVNHAVVDCPVDRFESCTFLHLQHLLHLLDEFALKDEQVAQSRVLK